MWIHFWFAYCATYIPFSMIIHTYHEFNVFMCECVCAIWERIAWVSFRMVFMELDDCQLYRQLNYTSARQNRFVNEHLFVLLFKINVFNWKLKIEKYHISSKPFNNLQNTVRVNAPVRFLSVHIHIASGKLVWHRTQRIELRMMASVRRHK